MGFHANTFFQIISIFYITLIGVVFTIKKKVESAENYIFRNLVIIGFCAAVADVVSIVLGFNDPVSIISLIAAKIYLLTLARFCIVMTEYSIIITNTNYNNEEKLARYKKLRKYTWGIFALVAIAILMAPISIYTQNDTVMYSEGPAVTVTYLVCGFSILLWVSLLIARSRNLAPRKTFPIVGVVVVGGLAALIQLFNPQILLVTASMNFSIAIMYFSVFTIENPDLEMVEEIKKARNSAIKASNAKTDFLSNMSHELRTPLNAILGFSQGLLEQDLEPSVKSDIEDIVSASDTLLELVNEILDISKIESEKFEIVDVEYSVNKMFKYLVTMTEGRIGSRQLEFIHEYDENIPPVLYGDCVRIKQIVVNLLTNSVKYTKEGYVKLTMKYEKIDDESGYLVIAVSDSGIGIKEEDIKKLFSKFSRLDLEENANVEGTGLGLALTKKLVELMDGDIKVESKYGIGSVFTVKIKQKIVHKTVEEVEKENPLLARSQFTGHGERILVVDDNNVNLRVASRLLKPYKLELDLINTGKECLDKIQNGEHYDMILLDDQMPVMTGVEVIKKLKEIEGFHIPTIAMTANAISGMKEKYLKEGFDGYLAKPVDKILLEDLLIEFLENKKKENNNPQPVVKEEKVSTKPEEKVEEKKEEVVEELIEEEKTVDNDLPQIIRVVEEEVLEEKPVEKIPPVYEEEVLEEKPVEKIPPVYEEEVLEEAEKVEELLEEEPEEVLEETSSQKGSKEYLISQGVDVNKALESLGDMEMYQETAEDVYSEAENKLTDLQKFIDLKDMTNYSVVAHALKSDLKYVGMFDLAEIALQHENAGKEGRLDFAKENINSLIEETHKKMEILKNYLGK